MLQEALMFHKCTYLTTELTSSQIVADESCIESQWDREALITYTRMDLAPT
jgi:hypothetical protein